MKPWIAIVCGLEEEERCINAPDGAIIVRSFGSADKVTAGVDAAIRAGVSHVLVVGTAGGLAPHIEAGGVAVALSIVGPDGTRILCDQTWASSLLYLTHDLKSFGVDIVTAAETIATPAAKQALYASTKCGVVNLEAFPAAAVAEKYGVSVAAVHVISDTARQTIPAAALAAMGKTGSLDVEGMLNSLIEHNEQMADFDALAESATLALNVLPQVLADIGPEFGVPDL